MWRNASHMWRTNRRAETHDESVNVLLGVHLGITMAHMDTDAGLPEADKDARVELARLDAAIADELRALRGKRRMSQKELAVATGIGLRTMTRIENAEQPMSIKQLYLICHALGVKPSDLISGAESEIGI